MGGDEIICCVKKIIESKYDQRGRKVRYDDVVRYYAIHGKIQEVLPTGYIVDGMMIYDDDICCNIEEARELAKKRQNNYEERVYAASMLR